MKDKLKSNNIIGIILSLTIISFNLYCCQSSSEKQEQKQVIKKKEEQLYYCPMDTQIVQKGPGECPICHMELELKLDQHQYNPYEAVIAPANSSVLSNIKSVKPVRKMLPIVVNVLGKVEYDPERVYDISSRFAGRIEKLYVKFTFQPVKKGEALFDIFSHELLSAQRNYLYLQENDPDATELIAASEKKLQLLGMTTEQIRILHKRHDGIHPTTTIYSPYTGYVIEESEDNSNTTPTNNGGMSESNPEAMKNTPSSTTETDLTIREGAYVDKGQKVFKVVNTDRVWGVFEAYSNQLSLVKRNQSIKFIVENSNDTLTGKVDFIEPVYDEELRTGKIRVYIPNKNQQLKIGNILHGEINAGEKEDLWIPRSALLDLGKEELVFVKEGQVYKTKKVTTGVSSGNMIEIVEGIDKDVEIAEDAQYMVDSESFVKDDSNIK